MAKLPQGQLDLFIASASDVSPKAHQDLMARCWFSLSKKKRTLPIIHRMSDSFIEITGDDRYGIATIFDNDVLVANDSPVEATTDYMNILSNGFKLTISSDPNVAETYIYMAFAEAPFVNSNGVPCNAR